MERLQKVIAASGYCSRRKAEELIVAGKVYINGKKNTELGVKVSGNDTVMIDGNVISSENKEYILLNKPRGVVSTTSDDLGRDTVVSLVNSSNRLYPIGRLDYDTTGLILLTNDGELTNLLLHPSNNIDKVYVAKVKGLVHKSDIIKLGRGVMVEGVKLRGKSRILKYDKKSDSSIVELIIHEGKNHQVKNMFLALGFDVVKLKREKIDFLDLKGVGVGEYRHLSIKEVKKLYSLK